MTLGPCPPRVDEVFASRDRLVERDPRVGIAPERGQRRAPREPSLAGRGRGRDRTIGIAQRVGRATRRDAGEGAPAEELRVVGLSRDRGVEVGQRALGLASLTQRERAQVAQVGAVLDRDGAVEVGPRAVEIVAIDAKQRPSLAVAGAIGRQRDGAIEVCRALRIGRSVLVAAQKRHQLVFRGIVGRVEADGHGDRDQQRDEDHEEREPTQRRTPHGAEHATPSEHPAAYARARGVPLARGERASGRRRPSAP